MGLFDDFDIDMDDVKAAGFSNPDDGTYEFEITEARIQNGTKKAPDDVAFVISYNLDEAGTKQEWFTVAQDGEMTARAKQSLGFLKSRLIDLGFTGSLNDIAPEDLEGIRGTLKLVTSKTAKGEFQNVKNVQVLDTEDEEEEVEEAPAKPAKRTATVKKVAAKRKPAPEPDEDDENPFE